MEDITKEQGKLLAEISPYVDDMMIIYKELFCSLIKNGVNEEEADDTACLGAVMAGIATSRKTKEVTESVDNIILAKEIFKVMIHLEKLIRMGIVKAKVKGKDEYGFPMYELTEIPNMEAFGGQCI